MQISTFFFFSIAVLTSGYPGLRKIPKVYNALITSNQNLSPSRAFPVLQPVIHRTAVGYVPPIYYPQFAPQFVPEIIDVGQLTQTNLKSQKTNQPNVNNKESQNPELNFNKSKDEGSEKKVKKETAPLKFYPNYQTLLYDPYFYTYSGLGSQIQQTSYQNQQSQQSLNPIPPEVNKEYVERLLPNLQDEKELNIEEREKIPNVPPPPLPTAVPK